MGKSLKPKTAENFKPQTIFAHILNYEMAQDKVRKHFIADFSKPFIKFLDML
jgi:hypothetical protein